MKEKFVVSQHDFLWTIRGTKGNLAIDENVMRNEILSTWNALSSETRAPLTQCNACGTILETIKSGPFARHPLESIFTLYPLGSHSPNLIFKTCNSSCSVSDLDSQIKPVYTLSF